MKKLAAILWLLLFPVAAFPQATGAEISTPSGSPPSGYQYYYIKSGSSFCTKNSSGTEFCIGANGGATLQTNGTNNSSQSVLNFITSTVNSVGLTITPSNPSGGQEQLEITGANYNGNASTATALAPSGSLPYALGTVTTTAAITPVNGLYQTMTLTAGDTCVVTFTQPVSGQVTITVVVTQAATPTGLVTWTSVKWPGGVAPVMTPSTNAPDIYTFKLNGTYIYGTAAQNFH
jgi:hypothetical protein